MKLYHCETVEQYKLGELLEAQGVTRDDVAAVELITRDTVRLTNPAGQYMVVQYRDGQCVFL